VRIASTTVLLSDMSSRPLRHIAIRIRHIMEYLPAKLHFTYLTARDSIRLDSRLNLEASGHGCGR